ncbi:MAG: hypothetical protein JNM31_02300 [Flavobacteriales bacterium]|nr:hypothetical protein [Flavobacteriales bacterium]
MGVLRRLRTAAIVLGCLLVVLVTALVALSRMYEEEVKANLVGTLNTHLNAPVSVGPMDLTLLRRFPLASLHLQEVLAMEVAPDKPTPDTLLYADDLFLEFNLWDLFRGDYTVRSVHGENVRLHPAIHPDGTTNYTIWRADSTSSASAFALQRVTVDALQVRYRDARSATEIAGSSPRVSLTGRFRPEGHEVGLNGMLVLDHWTTGDALRLGDRQARVRMDMAFGGANGAFRIAGGEVLVGDAPVEVNLTIAPGKKGDEIDLLASGFGLDLAATVDLLPEDLRRVLRPYQMKGSADIALRYTGPLDAPGPQLSLGIDVKDARLKERTSGAALTAVQGGMALELGPDGTLHKLVVKGLNGRAAGGSFACSGELNGARNTAVKADLKTNIGLAELARFMRLDTLEQVAGKLRAEIHVEGRLKELARVRPADLKALRISGNASLHGATLKMKGVRHRVTGLNAELAMDGADARVNSLTAEVQGTHVELSGTLQNLMPYLFFSDQQLLIAANAHSPRLDLAALLTDGASANAGREQPYVLHLPALIALDLQAGIDELVFEEVRASEVRGRIRMQDRVLVAHDLRFQTAQGQVHGSLELDGRGAGPYPLRITATAKDIAIAELFREFKDFGQAFITHQHLSGKAQAQVELVSPLSTSLALDMDRLYCTVDLAIDDGGIKGHQPLMEVADYVAGNKLIAPFVDANELRRQLAQVSFARLENRIEIRDRMVIVPAMEVRSNVMDLELSGTQTFDGNIDHHLNFRLSELFNRKPVEDEFGPIADDGTGMRLFLHMSGTTTEPRFSNDGAAAAARRTKAVREQTAELRSILKNELNLFGRKEARPAQQPGQPAPLIVVEGAQPLPADTAPVGVAGTTKPPRKGLGRLLDKDEESERRETVNVVD